MEFSMVFTLGDLFQALTLIGVVFLAWHNLTLGQTRLEEKYLALAGVVSSLIGRLDSVEIQTDVELKGLRADHKNLREAQSAGLQRIYDKLDGKVDKG